MAKKKVISEDKHKLTPKEALGLLAPHLEGRKKRVHSLVDCSIALLGADMDLSDVKKAFKETDDIRLAGPNMKGMGHGLAYWHNKMGYVFLETDMNKINTIHLERGI